MYLSDIHGQATKHYKTNFSQLLDILALFPLEFYLQMLTPAPFESGTTYSEGVPGCRTGAQDICIIDTFRLDLSHLGLI